MSEEKNAMARWREERKNCQGQKRLDASVPTTARLPEEDQSPMMTVMRRDRLEKENPPGEPFVSWCVSSSGDCHVITVCFASCIFQVKTLTKITSTQHLNLSKLVNLTQDFKSDQNKRLCKRLCMIRCFFQPWKMSSDLIAYLMYCRYGAIIGRHL